MPVEKYYGLITANQVAGTGFFSDLTASFSDLFGGNSGVYRESLNELCKDVTDRLKAKARDMGANAILGVSINYDSISAKNTSMFMVSIQGTAVKLSAPVEESQVLAENEITFEMLSVEYFKKKILRKIKSNVALDQDEWQYVQKKPVPALFEPLYEYYIKCRDAKPATVAAGALVEPVRPAWAKAGVQNYIKFLYSLNYQDAVEYAYRDATTFKHVIQQNKLFNAKKILEVAKQGKLEDALSLLFVEKPSYNDVDLEEMKTLRYYLNHLPEVGKKETVKGGLFSSDTIKFVCTCGCKNAPNEPYCTQCGKNMQGITKQQEEDIKQFGELVDTLNDLIK